MTTKSRALLLAVAFAVAALLAPAGAPASTALSRAPLAPAFRDQVASGSALMRSPIIVQRGSAARPLLRAVGLPDRYDLRDPDPAGSAPSLVTAVRDQGRYNTCWAFSTMAALESRLLYGGETWDLSEDNLVTRSGFGPFAAGPYAYGGNYQMSSAYFARWAGPLTETADPYHTPATKPLSPVRKHVQGVALLAPRQSAADNDAIKSAVMSYGAVATQMYYPASDVGVYDATTHAFYYAGSAEANHGVAIVGWDDTYGAANFSSTPPGDGAFLVRNSWGAVWGDGGHFWISYHDSVLARVDQSMALSRVDPVGAYARAYGYDKLGWTSSIGLTGTADPGLAKFASRFTARASEKVAAVSFYTIAPNAAYRVYAGPSFGELTLRGSGTVADAGYCTVPLSARMYVAKGRKFIVAVRLDVPGTKYPVPIEAPVARYAPATASAGQSFIRVGGRWADITSSPGYTDTNVCLKAFTKK